MLNREARLLAVGRRQPISRPVDRRIQARNRREQRPAAGGLESRRRRSAFEHLLESVDAIFLERTSQIRQNVAIEEDSVSRAQNPTGRGLVRQADTGADVVGVLRERLGQVLEVVTQSKVYGQVLRHRPMILQECAGTGHRVSGLY